MATTPSETVTNDTDEPAARQATADVMNPQPGLSPNEKRWREWALTIVSYLPWREFLKEGADITQLNDDELRTVMLLAWGYSMATRRPAR